MSDSKTLRVGDKEYSLRMTLHSLRLIGEKLNIRIRPGHINEDLMGQPLDLGVFGVVLWACLQHHADPPSLDAVENAVDQDNFAEVLERFFGLFGATSAASRVRTMLDGVPGTGTAPENEGTQQAV